MAKRQIRRLPIARKGEPKAVGMALEAIFEPNGYSTVSSAAKAGSMIAGGLGLGAGLFCLLEPLRARR